MRAALLRERERIQNMAEYGLYMLNTVGEHVESIFQHFELRAQVSLIQTYESNTKGLRIFQHRFGFFKICESSHS